MKRKVGINPLEGTEPLFELETKESKILVKVILNDDMMYSVTIPVDVKTASELQDALNEAIKEINPK